MLTIFCNRIRGPPQSLKSPSPSAKSRWPTDWPSTERMGWVGGCGLGWGTILIWRPQHFCSFGPPPPSFVRISKLIGEVIHDKATSVVSYEFWGRRHMCTVCSLRTIRGEKVDLYGVHMAALHSALEGMAPNDRANWNGRLSGRLGEVHGYGFRLQWQSDIVTMLWNCKSVKIMNLSVSWDYPDSY